MANSHQGSERREQTEGAPASRNDWRRQTLVRARNDGNKRREHRSTWNDWRRQTLIRARNDGNKRGCSVTDSGVQYGVHSIVWLDHCGNQHHRDYVAAELFGSFTSQFGTNASSLFTSFNAACIRYVFSHRWVRCGRKWFDLHKLRSNRHRHFHGRNGSYRNWNGH